MKIKMPRVDSAFVFAEGSMDGVRSEDSFAKYFRVRIEYREPEFEARTGARETPYRFTYRIAAGSDVQAREDALAEFSETTALSSVGWRREIVAVNVEPIDDAIELS